MKSTFYKKNTKSLEFFFKFLDIYGTKIDFTINKETKSKTIIGGVLTLISIFLFIIYGIIISKNLIYHKNPLITRIGLIGGKYIEIEDTLSEMPISLTFEGMANDKLLNYFTLFTYYEVLDVKKNELIVKEEIPLQKCTHKFFPNHDIDVYNSEITNMFCLNGTDLKEKTRLFFSEGKKGFIFIQLSYCKSELNPNCESKETIMNFINNNTNSFVVKIGVSGIHPLNYNNPLLYSIESFNIIPTLHYVKYIDIAIQEEDLETDDGLFYKRIKYVKTYSSLKTFNFFQIDKNDLNLALFRISPSNHLFVNIRTYTRIQDILSQLGGILSLALHFFPFVVYVISKGRRDEKILNTLLDFDLNNEKDISPINSNVLRNYNSEIRNGKTSIIKVDKNKSIESSNFILNHKFHKLTANNNFFLHLKSTINEEREINQFLQRWKNRTNTQIRFSNCEILKMYLCKCKCVRANITSKKQLLFFKYKEMIYQYLEVPFFISKIEEHDKLKYILFNKEQLSLFKYISNEIISHNFTLQKNKFTSKKLFYNDDKEISAKILNFLKHNKQVFLNDIDKRLVNYFYESYNI